MSLWKKGAFPMSAHENMRTVRRVYEEVFEKHNLAIVDELYAPDFVYHSPGHPDFDREGLKQGLGSYVNAFPNAQMTIEDMFAAGDRVAVRFTARGTHQGEFLGVPPTGKEITITSILIHRLAGGKMVEDWEWEDQFGVRRQLGLVTV
jgi:steroid delta-isomerase-like uncharacterized protein